MVAKIFISYRRDDSSGQAGRVFDRLEREFGRDRLFMDVDAVPLGVDFMKVLREEVAKCSALLAVIGPRWLDACDEQGIRRLDNPKDFVRVELAAALQRAIPVIPILLDGARVPKADRLPKELEALTLRNALDIRHVSFGSDMHKLIRALEPLLASSDQIGATLPAEFGEGFHKHSRVSPLSPRDHEIYLVTHIETENILQEIKVHYCCHGDVRTKA
jgi:TIR domain